MPTTCSSSFLPCGPISLKPDETMTAPPTPASPHSRSTSGHGLGRHGDDGEVDLARHLADGRVGLDALDRRRGAVDRVDDARRIGADEVAQQDVADRALLVGGADDGDALGVEQLVEVVCAHELPRAPMAQSRRPFGAVAVVRVHPRRRVASGSADRMQPARDARDPLRRRPTHAQTRGGRPARPPSRKALVPSGARLTEPRA